MSYSLNSSKGGYIREYIGDYYRGYQGRYLEFFTMAQVVLGFNVEPPPSTPSNMKTLNPKQLVRMTVQSLGPLLWFHVNFGG